MNNSLAGMLVALLIGGGLGYVLGSKMGDKYEPEETYKSQTTQKVTATAGTVEWKIQNAMSAAPAYIAKGAAVLDWPGADGKLPELRKGTNGWTCLPDIPTSPGNDPICVDQLTMGWFAAYMQKKAPNLKQVGIGYMLQGSSDASNVDPYAEKPAPGEDWVTAPPHVMVFPTGKLDARVYGTVPNGGPWIMWAGTPYEHLMIPVK